MFLSYCQIWVQEVQKVQWVQVRSIRLIRGRNKNRKRSAAWKAVRQRIGSAVRYRTGRFFPVYRLGEDGDLNNEGGVRLSFWALRASSYKTRAEV